MSEDTIRTKLELVDGYKFLAHFDEDRIPPLLMDEPAPLGKNAGPNPNQVLSSAVGNCLSASALFCLRKAHVAVNGMQTQVVTKLGRNPQGRIRIVEIKVHITIDVPGDQRSRMSRCMDLFEDLCIVTQSVIRIALR